MDDLPTHIVLYPDPRLRAKCAPVEAFDGALAALADRMLELMRAANGVGLAAPQVGVCRRLFVCNPTGDPADDRVYVNPEVIDLIGAAEAEEGCLSLPEVRAEVRRARRCRFGAVDLSGRPVEESGEDLVARIWQHEIDHLDGRLIIDLMKPADRIANKRLLEQLEADYRSKHKHAGRRAR